MRDLNSAIFPARAEGIKDLLVFDVYVCIWKKHILEVKRVVKRIKHYVTSCMYEEKRIATWMLTEV